MAQILGKEVGPIGYGLMSRFYQSLEDHELYRTDRQKALASNRCWTMEILSSCTLRLNRAATSGMVESSTARRYVFFLPTPDSRRLPAAKRGADVKCSGTIGSKQSCLIGEVLCQVPCRRRQSAVEHQRW